MITFEGIKENFKFLIVETQKQVVATLDALRRPDPAACEKILSTDDYIDNLKTIVENKAYTRLNIEKKLPKKEIDQIRATQTISVNLERIADHCVGIIRQLGHFEDPSILNNFDYETPFGKIKESISIIEKVYNNFDMAGALSICKAEYELDVIYKNTFDDIMKRMADGGHIQGLLTVLFIFRYLERIGDMLLNIGEALIFIVIGEKIKIHQFQSLRHILNESGYEGAISEIDFRGIWGTKSGTTIGRIDQTRSKDEDTHESIFKEGNPKKIRAEKDNLEFWNKKLPGLTPKVFSFHEGRGNASLLVQYLPGRTMDEFILNADDWMLDEALQILEHTVENVWTVTRKDMPIHTDYMKQLQNRLGHINHLHPEFKRGEFSVGKTFVKSSDDLFKTCEDIEKEVKAPFTVLIHGDFNSNNIIYDIDQKRIYYIDLYRSKEADYIQDVSVFLISNFRMPVFEDKLRGRLNWIIEYFYSFASDFAHRNGDLDFDIRMALALARSFLTSTRFELNAEFAREMCKRSYNLLEKVLKHKDEGSEWESFKMPASVLYY